MIHGERIRQARELCGLTQTELADAVKIKQPAIAQIETGVTQPSDEVLQGIAFRTGFPLAFFRKPITTDFPVGSLLFRARAAMTQSERRSAHQYAHLIYEQFKFLAAQVRKPPMTLRRLDEDPIRAAKRTRSYLGLSPNAPIANLIRSIEKAGIIVLALPREMERGDAFSTWVSNEGLEPVIVLATTAGGDRLRFSVAHELGHLVLHYEMRSDVTSVEREADAFASEFLMPEEAMRRELTTPVTLAALQMLKPRWKVSIQVLVMRARDLEIINARQYKYLFEQIGWRGWRSEEPIKIPPEKPRALRRMAELIYGDPVNFKRLANGLDHPIFVVRHTLEAHQGSNRKVSDKKDSRPAQVRSFADFARDKWLNDREALD